MSNILLKTVVRTLFACTGRAKSSRQCESALGRYLALARGLSEEDGRRMVEVPWMPGIDEDMRRWSFFMILEHNAIVNRAITANVVQLSRGEDPSGAAVIDVKNEVMPSGSAGPASACNWRVKNHPYRHGEERSWPERRRPGPARISWMARGRASRTFGLIA
jgi:hypothetical protein